MKSFLKWTLLLTGLMPVVYSANTLFPYIFPKALYFKALICAAVLTFCILSAVDQKFRNEMIEKATSLWKHSVFKVMTLFYGSLILSTIFAFDRYMAMFGNIEREEGFVGLFFFYVFFVLLTLVFEKKDWLNFFAVNLFTGGILFLVELSEYGVNGNDRPGSLTDNPIFLATYYLFIIVAALVIWKKGKEKNNMPVMVVSVFSIIISFVGMFMTQTRGTLLGMFVGLIVVFVYLGFKGRNITIAKNISLKKGLLIMSIVFVLFTSVFVSTRRADFWTHIPGLSRIAQISTNDATTRSRFVNASIVLHAVNPMESSIPRSLFGWGWDNYIYAWQKFYQPRLYQYDGALFDRAHDKVLDVLLMDGFVGFVLYLGLWFVFFKKALKKSKEFSVISALLIFWGVTYFLQNLTVFDTWVTFITFYAMFAYLTNETRENTNEIIAK